jgi:hypothetical protein
MTNTDDDGRYEFVKLPAGSYNVFASQPGFIALAYGQRRVPGAGEPIELGSTETHDRIDIALPRPGAITGRVLDEAGDSVEGASVRVLQVQYDSGRRRLALASDVSAQRTDDRGRYRLYGLRPGEYIVSAVVGNLQPITGQLVADLPGYATTYFPGTTNPGEAQRVTIELSREATGADFALARVATARVAGTAFDAAGKAIGGGLTLTPSRRSGALAIDAVGASFSPGGAFEFSNVPPGEYVLQAFKPGSTPNTEGESAFLFVPVTGSDVTGLVVRLSTGSTIKGHITLDGRSEPPPYAGLVLSPLPVDVDRPPVSAANAEIAADWTFEMAGISGPRLFRVKRGARGWALKAVLLNGIDVTDTPVSFGTRNQSVDNLEVVLTDVVSHISGIVTDARNRGVGNAAVIIFPADRQSRSEGSRFLTMTNTERGGRFSAAGLPAGEYYVAAVDQSAAAEGQDPDFLESLRLSATRITLAEGQNTSLALRVVAR